MSCRVVVCCRLKVGQKNDHRCMVKKQTFIHAAEAALAGLHARLRGDQALVHCLDFFAQQVDHPAQHDCRENTAEGHGARGALRNVSEPEMHKHGGKLKGLVDGASNKEGFHRSGPLLLCGAARGHQLFVADNASRVLHDQRIPVGRNFDFPRTGLRYGGGRDAKMFSQSSLSARLGFAPFSEGQVNFHANRLADACFVVKHSLIYFLVVSRHG